MQVLLISTYELGRQPFGLASPAAWLRRSGHEVTCVDVSRMRLLDDQIARADVAAFYLPMHTATRLAVPVIDRVRRLNARAHLCAYGLYAEINAEFLRSCGIATVIGPEFEAALVEAVEDAEATLKRRPTQEGEGRPSYTPVVRARPEPSRRGFSVAGRIPRLPFIAPDRSGLPPLTRYASLELAPGVRRTVGYTEASRGCKHLCRHCPIVPVYNGQFRTVPVEVVVADVRAQVAQGAQHVTFGDPDFFNGITHAMRVVEAVARACPGVTYDVTIKIEHLLTHRDRLAALCDTGCLFITSAVESLDDEVLHRLAKGHTRRDFFEAVDLTRAAGIALAPTFVAFTPWTTLTAYCDLLDTIEALDLVGHVSPIQWAIRLLLPEGSRLLELAEVRDLARPLHPSTLTHPWCHPDPAVDDLQREIEQMVGVRLNADRFDVFERVSAVAHDRALTRRPAPARPARRRRAARNRATIPYLNEPWYC